MVKHPIAMYADALPEAWYTVDAPADWSTREPDRVLLQTIDGRFHQWSEFDTDVGTMFIVTESPVRQALSARESAGLLAASSSWIDNTDLGALLDPLTEVAEVDAGQVAGAGSGAGATSTVDGPDDLPAGRVDGTSDAGSGRSREDLPVDPIANLGSADGVIGTDNRIRVTGTTENPFNTIGYVGNEFPNSTNWRGTAFLVTPFVALTNAHNIYNVDRGGYITEIDFSPGQRQDSAGGTVTSPYQTLNAQSWETNSGYIGAGSGYTNTHIQFDYAGLFFDRSWQTRGIGTFMPLAFEISPGAVNTAGYPRVVQSETNSQSQWRSFGTYSTVDGRILRYDNDITGGNSGGPSWEFFSSTNTRRVVALTSFESGSFNGGPRLVSQNQSLIASWMTHAPSIGSDRFEGNNTVATATNLGVLGYRREDNLTIHAGGNDDYYTFIPRFGGTMRIDALFNDLDGDVDIQLLDAGGAVIASSTSVTDNELINATVIAGADYRLRVYGFAGQTHPEYDLVLSAPSPFLDRFEYNDTAATAHSFGSVTSINESNLTIHSTTDPDYFRINTVGSGNLTINLGFRHAAGDVDMHLLDSIGNVVASSTGTANTEQIVYPVTPGQAYTLHVIGYSSALNQYNLSITAPAGRGPVVTGSGFLYENSQQVWVEFDSDVSASLAAGDLSLSRIGGGSAVTPARVEWFPSIRTAIWTATGQLSDGNWRATLPAGSVHAGGPGLSAPRTVDFFVLGGDANRDRVVDVADLGVLAANFRTTGRFFSEGDFDYNGNVDVVDLGILAANMRMSLPASLSGTILRPAPTASPRMPSPMEELLKDQTQTNLLA